MNTAMPAPKTVTPLGSYHYGWPDVASYNAARLASAGKGVTQVGLMDEPEEFKDVPDYCKKLLESLIAQTKALAPADRAIANIENVWPRDKFGNPDFTDLPTIRKTALSLRGVLLLWQKACGKREAGYDAYGLFAGDRWGWAQDDKRHERNAIVAAECRGAISAVSVDAYFTQGHGADLNMIDGDAQRFVALHGYHDCRMAQQLWGVPTRLWISHLVNAPGPTREVPRYLWQAASRWATTMVKRRVCAEAVHFAGWDGDAKSGQVFSEAEKGYVDDFVTAMRS